MRASPGASGTPSSSNGVASTGQTPEMGRASAVAVDGIERFHSDRIDNKGIADTVSAPRPSVNTKAVFGYNSYLCDLRFAQGSPRGTCSHHPFRRCRHTAVAVVARVGAEAFRHAAGWR